MLKQETYRIEVTKIFFIVNMRKRLSGAFNQKSKLVDILKPEKHSDYIEKIALFGHKEPRTICKNENNARYINYILP